MAVGEMSPENENNSQLSSQQAKQASPRIRKQDSYLKAIGMKSESPQLAAYEFAESDLMHPICCMEIYCTERD